MRRALAIDEKSYGPEHPNVARDLNNLAKLLQATNRLAEAVPLIRRALVILLKFTRTTTHLHPGLRKVFGNYIDLLEKMKLPAEQISERLSEAGKDAGFDAERFRELRARTMQEPLLNAL
jgi:Tetratricopeptide repeat